MYKGRNGVHTRVLSADRNVQGAALCMSTAARGSGGISLQAGHHSSGGACSAHGARSILCDRSVLANLRRADGFGGGLVRCQLLSLEQHRSVVLPQVPAGSIDRSSRGASVRFSVSLRVGSSGLLGDLAGLATKTLAAARWRAASRITALSHTGRRAREPTIFVLLCRPAVALPGH